MFCFVCVIIIIVFVCLLIAQIFVIILHELATGSDELKSPVTLPDIEAQLQDLKLKNDDYLKEGLIKGYKKSEPSKLQFDGKGKHILPPLTHTKGKAFIDTKMNSTDEDKSRKIAISDQHTKGLAHRKDGKIKVEVTKRVHEQPLIGLSPRKSQEVKNISKGEETDRSPRKHFDNKVLSNTNESSPRDGGESKGRSIIEKKSEISPRKSVNVDLSPRKSIR